MSVRHGPALGTSKRAYHGGGSCGRPSRSDTRAGVLVAAMGALIVGVAACGGGSDFEAGDPGSIGSLEDLTAQQPDFTLLGIQINDPGEEVEVLRVRALASPNVQFLGARTTWPRNGKDSAILSGLGYPSPSMRVHHQAIGTVIPAAETAFVYDGETAPRGVFVTVGFRLASGKVGLVHAIEVTYRAGDHTRTERGRIAVIACPSPCSAKPKERTLDEWESDVREELGLVVSDSADLPT